MRMLLAGPAIFASRYGIGLVNKATGAIDRNRELCIMRIILQSSDIRFW